MDRKIDPPIYIWYVLVVVDVIQVVVEVEEEHRSSVEHLMEGVVEGKTLVEGNLMEVVHYNPVVGCRKSCCHVMECC
jgi:hypothetical protein